MATGAGAESAGDVGDSGHELAEEFWGFVRMDDVLRAAVEVQFIEQARYEGRSFPVGEGDQENGFGKTVNQRQGLDFAGGGEALALEIHGIAGAGFGGGVRGKETVG